MRDFFAFCLVLLVISLGGVVVLSRSLDASGNNMKGLRDAIQTVVGVEKPQQ
jgi:hypothetical protein